MIKECNMNHLYQIVDLAYELNNKPESNSAFCFKDYEAIKDDFTFMINSNENLVIGYFEDDNLVGVTGIVLDEMNKTADWIGPFIINKEYIKIAKEMLEYAKVKLTNTNEFNFFFNCKNTINKMFLEEINGNYITNEFNLTLHRDTYRLKSVINTENEAPTHRMKDIEFINSHSSTVLPNTNESNFFGPPGKKVFYLTMKDELIGYGTYNIWNNSERASIHMLRVMPDYKGNGYEEHLLKSLIQYIYKDSKIHTIGIVLEKKDETLLDICIKHGFEITADNYSYILTVRKNK